ncbi:MAG TPA: universal stress protein [Gemmatimonadaceae bacterium]
MFRSLLVPLDGSRFAEFALPFAASIAKRTGAALHLVRVHLPVRDAAIPGVADYDAASRAVERADLQCVVQRLQRDWEIGATLSVEEDPAAQAICARALAVGADLIVMTSHGRTGVSRLWIGSVADAVVRDAAVPVLLLRPRETTLPIESERLFSDILLPLDGSAGAESIIPHALALGSLGGARYTLLRVVQPWVTPVVAFPEVPVPFLDEQVLERSKACARAYLGSVADRMRAADPSADVRTEVVVHELPAVAVLDYLQRGEFDLVALTTHGGGLRRLVLGSVADKLLRGAMAPLLIHRPAAT